MSRRSRACAVLLLLLSSAHGCSQPREHAGAPGDPKASDVVLAHWSALQKRDWRAAYGQLHPDLAAAGLTLKAFTQIHAKRSASKGLPQKIAIAGSEQTADAVVVSFDLLSIPPGGGEPVAVSPRRKATLRKSGQSWRLMTHDLLALER
jgi:hypothetical protein